MNKIISTLVIFLITLSAFGQSKFEDQMRVEFPLSNSASSGDTVDLGSLPEGAVIQCAWIHVFTTFTSSSDAATIELGYEGDSDAFDAGVAISNGANPWDDAGPRPTDLAVCDSVTNWVEIDSTVQILQTVGSEDLTAGEGSLFIEYYVGD